MNSKNRIYPFKFLDTYSREDRDIFFGRDLETDTLYDMLFTTNIMLLYGASGTGKSSLIECGLASKFKTHDWLAIFVRRNNNLLTSLSAAVDEALIAEAGEALGGDSETLIHRIKHLYLETFRPVYLIFDQFEELFISGDKQEQNSFIENAKNILRSDLPIKMIFSIREEYLGHLAFFERAFPELLAKKFRLEAMDFEKTKLVLHSALNSQKSLIVVPEKEQEAVYEVIFNKVRGSEKSLTIQLPYLQVFLHNLYHDILEEGSNSLEVKFTIDAVRNTGDIGDVLREFLENEVKRMAVVNLITESVLWSILSKFSTLEGTKEHVFLKDVEKAFPLVRCIPETINILVSRKILRRLESDGALELMHDSLAQKIAEKRSEKDVALLEIKRLIRSQVNISKKTGEGFTERQIIIIDTYWSDLERDELLDEEEYRLLNFSRIHIQSLKEQELEKQKDELSRARREALEAEQINKKMQSLNRWLIILFVSLLIVGIGGFWSYTTSIKDREEQRSRNEAEKARNIKRNIAERFLTSGIEFEKLGIDSFAMDSYEQGIETLKGYPTDSIYKELQEHLAK